MREERFGLGFDWVRFVTAIFFRTVKYRIVFVVLSFEEICLCVSVALRCLMRSYCRPIFMRLKLKRLQTKIKYNFEFDKKKWCVNWFVKKRKKIYEFVHSEWTWKKKMMVWIDSEMRSRFVSIAHQHCVFSAKSLYYISEANVELLRIFSFYVGFVCDIDLR